ncbi:MAG: glycosyl transferase family 1 [SAR86 cluster bacterium]|uniref:Glycosyl transferase family 1 n=1 Tax=SAR86 cluster bacterium TaxID=2030880 RepID=A0A2A4MPM0_9GAMM|nr:MAG: glycosyl transferase family 1 [SAR86 cluster bacterium]
MPAHFFKDRYTIGYWAWELEEIPDNWLTAFQDVDEVWVPSHFVKAAVEKKSPVPVTVIPHCVQIKPTLEPGRDYFGIPAESFVFLSMFDSRSIAQRKNPYAAIEAFKQAFKAFDADDPQSPCLVLKLNNANAEDIEQLEALMAGYKLVLLTKHHSRAEINALLSIMDCYVSLHRSEGFGLAPAEAMSLGKVALLTNWSGNIDYMTADNCLPIDYTLITIKEDAGPYKAGQRWADANIDHAARAMAKIVAEPELRKQIGAAAKATIEKSFSPLAVGEMIKKRLDQIRKQRANI